MVVLILDLMKTSFLNALNTMLTVHPQSLSVDTSHKNGLRLVVSEI